MERSQLGIALAVIITLSGCGTRSTGTLVVATNWSASECSAIEQHLASLPDPVAVRWIRVPANAEPSAAAARGRGVDVILGGRQESHAYLANHSLLTHLDPADSRPWRVINRSAENAHPPLGAMLGGLVDSPTSWSAEYAHLVLGTDETPEQSTVSSLDGVSLVAGSSREAQAQRFVAALGETKPASPSASLLPVLIDATLIDCQNELRIARASVHTNSESARFRTWMTEAPPWPPASITRLRTQENGMALIATLVNQLAPDAASREWLMNAFDRVPQSLNGATLRELDEAVNGRLANDPRFRSWLRSEWTTWASQRYRRVTRGLVNSERPTS